MAVFYKTFSNEEEVIKHFDGDKLPKIGISACFAGYSSRYKEGGQIYMGFYTNEKILKLIDEVNANFSNIRVKIILYKEYILPITTGIFSENGMFTTRVDKLNWIVFKIELNDKYNDLAKFGLPLVMAQFLRGFCPQYSHHFKASKIEDNFINGILDAQSSLSYGAWLCCNYRTKYTKCEREIFNKFDDIDLVNTIAKKVFNTTSMPSISTFINVLKFGMEYAEEPKDDDIDDDDDNWDDD